MRFLKFLAVATPRWFVQSKRTVQYPIVPRFCWFLVWKKTCTCLYTMPDMNFTRVLHSFAKRWASTKVQLRSWTIFTGSKQSSTTNNRLSFLLFRVAFFPLTMGDHVFVGERAVINAAIVGSYIYIGKNAVIVRTRFAKALLTPSRASRHV